MYIRYTYEGSNVFYVHPYLRLLDRFDEISFECYAT